MKSKIISILIMTLLITATIMTVNGAMNVDKNNVESKATTKEKSTYQPWTIQFSFDATLATGASGNAGCEFDGTYFYTTRWASNEIHQYTSAGVLVKEFSIAGVTGLRDLAYCPTDGYLYGGAASSTIWGFDPIAETLEVTLTGNFQCRAIAYDEDLDVFYVSNWGDPVWIVDRTTGTINGQFDLVTTTSTYGFAYDSVCNSGGPYLWVFDQGDGAGQPQYIHQWDLSVPGYTGVQHDVNPDVGSGSGIAGGLFFTTDFAPGYATLGGLYQDGDPPGTGDWVFCYELCEYEECEASIDVEKYVWDPDHQEWIDADYNNTALDLPICTDTTFKIVIHNDGEEPLYDIIVKDKMHDSLKFISGDPEPDEIYYEKPFWYMEWYFPGPLMPCNTIELYITAHVNGPECSYDFNYVLVEAFGCGEIVRDEDYAWVHARCCFDVEIPGKFNIFKLKANVKEICGIDHTNVPWTMTITGKLLFPSSPATFNGTISSISANGVAPINSKFMIGLFGAITVTITIDNCKPKTFNGKILLFFIIM